MRLEVPHVRIRFTPAATPAPQRPPGPPALGVQRLSRQKCAATWRSSHACQPVTPRSWFTPI
eukprot:873906-Prorocentrum_minimum.AAC.1